MDSDLELDSDLEYDLQNLFESSEDEESYELSSVRPNWSIGTRFWRRTSISLYLSIGPNIDQLALTNWLAREKRFRDAGSAGRRCRR